jgi:hypothetical protein
MPTRRFTPHPLLPYVGKLNLISGKCAWRLSMEGSGNPLSARLIVDFPIAEMPKQLVMIVLWHFTQCHQVSLVQFQVSTID